MRISDWSSDVCSSDLDARLERREPEHRRRAAEETLDPRRRIIIFLERKGPRVAEPAREHGRRRLMPRRGEQIGGRAGAAVEEFIAAADQIGRASCRERGCQYV